MHLIAERLLTISPAQIDWSCFCDSVTKHSRAHLHYFTTAWFSGAVGGDKWFIFLSVHHSCSTLPKLFPLITLYDLCGNIQFANFGFSLMLCCMDRVGWYEFTTSAAQNKATVNTSFLMNNAALLRVSLTDAVPWFHMDLCCIPQDNQCDYKSLRLPWRDASSHHILSKLKPGCGLCRNDKLRNEQAENVSPNLEWLV